MPSGGRKEGRKMYYLLRRQRATDSNSKTRFLSVAFLISVIVFCLMCRAICRSKKFNQESIVCIDWLGVYDNDKARWLGLQIRYLKGPCIQHKITTYNLLQPPFLDLDSFC
jgi:hypothetical protein